MKKIVILYSGGLDSFIMMKYAEINYPNAETICVYYKHGAPSEDSEIAALPPNVVVKTVDWLDEYIQPIEKPSCPAHGPIYIPGRNLVFATLAACQYLPDEVWLGSLAGELNVRGTDKNETFAALASGTLSYTLSPFIPNVKVRMPLADEGWNKVDTVRWALDNGISEDEIIGTSSCLNVMQGNKPCGVCIECLKRFLVFSHHGFGEDYEVKEPAKDPRFLGRIEKIVSKFSAGEADNDEINVAMLWNDYLETLD